MMIVSRAFSYSVLEETSIDAKIVVYICDKNDLSSLQKALHLYSEEKGNVKIHVRDYSENKDTDIDTYIDKKKKDNIDICDPSFRQSHVYNPPWSEFIPVHVKIK